MKNKILPIISISLILISSFLSYYSGDVLGNNMSVAATFFWGGKITIFTALVGFFLLYKQPKYLFFIGIINVLVFIVYASGIFYGAEVCSKFNDNCDSETINSLQIGFGQIKLGVGLYLLIISSILLLVLEFKNFLELFKPSQSSEPVVSKTGKTIDFKAIYQNNRKIILPIGIVIIAGAIWMFSRTDIIVGKWQGGAFNEIVAFKKSNDHGYSANCASMGTNMTSNAFKLNQELFKDVVITNDSILTGQILVPMGSGDQSWYNFTGTISKNLIKVYIGEAKWAWAYKKN